MGTGLLATSCHQPFEYDWSLAWGRWQIGITEFHSGVIEFYDSKDAPISLTTIWLGPTSIETNLSAFQALGLGVIGALAVCALVAAVITRHRSGQAA
jgi:hypothetical protein